MDTGKVIALTRRMIKKELSDLGPYHYVGTVADVNELPLTANVGDVYNVGNTSDGNNYAWNGTEWDKLGGENNISPMFYPSRNLNLNNSFNLFTSISNTTASYDSLTEENYFGNLGTMSNTDVTNTSLNKEFLVQTNENLSGKYLYGWVRVGTWNNYIVYQSEKNQNDLYVGKQIWNNNTPVVLHLNTIDSTYSNGSFPPFYDIEVTIKYKESGQYYGPLNGTWYRYIVTINAIANEASTIINLNSFKTDVVSEVLNHYHPYLKYSKINERVTAEDLTVTGSDSNYWLKTSSTTFDSPSISIITPSGTTCSGCLKVQFQDDTWLTINIDNLVSSSTKYTWVFFFRYGTLLIPLIASGNTTTSLLVPFSDINNYPLINKGKITAYRLCPLNGETSTLPSGTTVTVYDGNNYEVF